MTLGLHVCLSHRAASLTVLLEDELRLVINNLTCGATSH